MICIAACCLVPVVLSSLLRGPSGSSLAVVLSLGPGGRVVMLPSVLRAGHAGPQAGKGSRVQGERGHRGTPLVVGRGSWRWVQGPPTRLWDAANRARQTSTCQIPATGLHRCSAAGLIRSGWAACWWHHWRSLAPPSRASGPPRPSDGWWAGLSDV